MRLSSLATGVAVAAVGTWALGCAHRSVGSFTPRTETVRVVGRLVDASGTPLAYALVDRPRTEYRTFSNEEGRFDLRLPVKFADSLHVDLIGFRDTVVVIRRYVPGDTLTTVLRPSWDPRGNPKAAETLVARLRAHRDVDAFVVGQYDFDATIPHFRHCPILATNLDPDPESIERLLRAIVEASRDGCRYGDWMCEFEPRYALRFQTASGPLELLISRDCFFALFYQGPNSIPSGSGGGFHCVRGEILSIMARLFPENPGP